MDWIAETLQDNGTLKNKLGIRNAHKLHELETLVTQHRQESLVRFPITSVIDLQKIHKWLFSDLYEWAGEFRQGDFQKGSTRFFPRSRFSLAIQDIDQQIYHINETHYKLKIIFSSDLANLLLDINNFHPFREGNGRAQRLFISMLAEQNGYIIHLANGSAIYEDYMNASKQDNLSLMADVVFRSIEE
ncbi:Fic/DOC family protein [Companilactobacillus mishanensis]|uniref:protein adenylyltransferase n=1 Tax=Companilactobacillus mishanensis TaxID=2486008 RepID=A0A5P0ZJH2_9LACO|nr:Fic family protein [Companilactobacillus mishanensis]MQS53224.1 cell division protein [Companilactobacillus mishanensis]